MRTRLLSIIGLFLIVFLAGCSLLQPAKATQSSTVIPGQPPAATQPPAKPAATPGDNPPPVATLNALATSVSSAGPAAAAGPRLVLLFSRVRPQSDGSFLVRVAHNPNRDQSMVGNCKFPVSESKIQYKITATSKTILPAGPVDKNLVYTGLGELNPTACSLELAWAGPDVDAENPDTLYRSISGKIKAITAATITLEGYDIPITVKNSKQLFGYGGQALKVGDTLNATITYVWTVNPDPSVVIGKNKITGYDLVIGYDASWLLKERQNSGDTAITIYMDEQLKN